MARSWTPVLVASASAGAVGAFFFWRYTRAAKAHLHVEEEPQEPQHEDPEKEEGYVEEPQILEIDFCVEGELQQCEHALGVVQCLRAERGSKQNVELDAAISALDELLPQYAAKLQEKRWLASKASLLDSTSEALQLLLLADDEQNLEAAAKSGRDIPELVFAAQSLNKILTSSGCCGGGGGCSSGERRAKTMLPVGDREFKGGSLSASTGHVPTAVLATVSPMRPMAHALPTWSTAPIQGIITKQMATPHTPLMRLSLQWKLL
eukprot:g3494.t1